MAKSRPDLFHAYIGAGQLVSYRENLDASYRKLIGLARAAGDTKTVSTIEAMGPPPWTDPRYFGIVRGATWAYEARTSTPGPKSWWVPAPFYATEAMQTDSESGEDFSYLQFVGLKGNGMFSLIDLPRLGLTFDLPVFLVQGSEDLVTVPEVAKRYFDSLAAPRKEFVLLPRTGHDPNSAMIDAEYDILKTRVAPLLN
jgi:pimeloyl-ACP methyl ester carboxylesterase